LVEFYRLRNEEAGDLNQNRENIDGEGLRMLLELASKLGAKLRAKIRAADEAALLAGVDEPTGDKWKITFYRSNGWKSA
jgi:hypothetical protein